MAAALENMNPNQHQGGSPTGADALPASFSPAKPSFLDPMAMLMAAKNEGNSEVDERAARALEQQLELQGRHEIEQVRLALQIQSEEDEALLQAAKQEEEDLLAAQLFQEQEEKAAREEREERIRREESDAELARKTAEMNEQVEKQQEASDAALAARIHQDLTRGFHLAIQKNQVAAITEYLNKGGDPGACIRHGQTSSPLQLAVEANLPGVVKRLIAAKAPLNYQDGHGDTALHWAARLKRMECIREIIAGGADLEVGNKQGFTPIISAAKAGNAEPIKLLVQHHANLYHKDKECKMALHHVPFLCRSLKTLIERMCGWGLLEAAAKGRGNEVTDLIRRGASTRLSDDMLRTPLHHAAINGHNIIVEYLILNKARLNAVDKMGQTALHKAAMHKHELVAFTLLRHGADASITDKTGKRAMDAAPNGSALHALFLSPPSPIKSDPSSSTDKAPKRASPMREALCDATPCASEALPDGGQGRPPNPPATRPSPTKGDASWEHDAGAATQRSVTLEPQQRM